MQVTRKSIGETEISDGVVTRRLIIDHDGRSAYSKLEQPSRKLILARNAELRKNPGALNNLQHMGLELCIPDADYELLKIKYPALSSRDHLERSLAWKNFLGSSESDPYRVRERTICHHSTGQKID